MIRQTALDFKIESTKEQLTAHGGIALLAEYHHGLGLGQLSDSTSQDRAATGAISPPPSWRALLSCFRRAGRRWRICGS